MVCAASGYLGQIRAAPEDLLAWPAQKTAGVDCGEDRGVFLWLQKLLGEQGGCATLGGFGLQHGWRAGSPALQAWVLDTLPKPQPSPSSTFPLCISCPGSSGW